MESISDKEKNYMIVQFILTGISPLVVREIFDKEFDPVCLKSSLSKEWKKIQQLKNERVFNQTQMNLLYPKGGIEPSSSKFDISLMLCLLRNFTNIYVYDQTPQQHDTSLAADLSRIRYYRNKCAHMNICEFSSEHFNLIWTDLTEAIKRLGGLQLYEKCLTLKQSLENSDQRIFFEIFNEMHSSMKEIGNLKEEIDRLKEEKKMEIDLLRVEQQEEAELQFLYISKENLQQNTEIKRKWREQLNNETFILSKAAISIFETIQHNQFVAVSGICGSGKSTLAQYTALRMSESHRYFVIYVPSALENCPLKYNYKKPDQKCLYILDDLFGKSSISDFDHISLTVMLNDVKYIAARHLNVRFLITCRQHVNVMSKIKDILPSIVECNLHSPELSLSLDERQKIFDLYIHDEVSVYQNNDFLLRTEQLPLLCKLYRKHFCNRIQNFILNSDYIITSKIEEMRESENPSYICLALLLVAGEFDTKYGLCECIRYGNYHTILQSVISESSFKKKPTASRKLLLSGFDTIEGIYVKREGNRLSFINDIIYDIVISCIGSEFINSIVKSADYSFIENRVRLEYFATEETAKSACIVLNQTYNEIYFARLLLEMRNRNERVFANIQNKNQGYRKAFIEYLKAHLTQSDVDYLKSPLHLSCTLGYDDFVSYIVGTWNIILEYPIYEIKTPTPLSEACSRGYFDIVKILVESEKDRDTGVKRIPDLPILRACEKGYTSIVEFLLTHGVYQDLNSGFVASCEYGHTEIVLLLIEKEPKLLERSGRNVLRMACENGHEEVVRILLRHNIPVNNTDSESIPLYYASMRGHLHIVTLLLNAKVQVNECDISVAEWNDHEEIVKCLRNHLNL